MTNMPPVADICDALEADARVIDLPFGAFTDTTEFAGPVRLIALYGPDKPLAHLLKTPGEGAVAVVKVNDATHPAVFGDGMAHDAEVMGWAGVIIDGNLRDVSLIAPRTIGILATGTNPRINRKGPDAVLNQPVTLGGVTLTDGDWVIADEDGVIAVTDAQARRFLD